MRKLVRIEKVRDVHSIQGADAIEVAVVQSWNVVVKKGEYSPGDWCVYFEIDSFLPQRNEFEFLRKSSYHKHHITNDWGFKLRTVKLRGQVSQGLLMPLSILNGFVEDEDYLLEEGWEVTDLLGVIKWEDVIPAQLAGTVVGLFPTNIVAKTDEERIQNLTDEYDSWRNSDLKFYATEKLDGASSTQFIYENEFGLCGRNYQLAESSKNSHWTYVREINLPERLKEKFNNIALQGELIGPGIQKNKYGLSKAKIVYFTAFDISKYKKLNLDEFTILCDELNLERVPVIDDDFKLPDSIDTLIYIAQGKSELNPKSEREGLVIRSYDNSISFKVISNKWLLNN